MSAGEELSHKVVAALNEYAKSGEGELCEANDIVMAAVLWLNMGGGESVEVAFRHAKGHLKGMKKRVMIVQEQGPRVGVAKLH